MLIEKKSKTAITALNKYDRKILDKYTKFYSNFIESNTAKTEMLADDRYRGNE